jgi:hypothetical protein
MNEGKIIFCEEDGCHEEASVKCYLPAMEEGEEDLSENLCAEHAAKRGYCICCGNFWAGCSSYDFSRIKGVCENCIVEFENPEEEKDEFDIPPDFDDDEFYYKDDWRPE